MFKGTHKHKAGEFDHILEARGAIVNAATWKDYKFYYVTLPKGENDENFDLAIELHAASRCANKALINDNIQDLYLALLTMIEDVKKDKLSPTNLLNDMLNTVKPNQSIFNNDMLRLDLILKRNDNI